MVNIPRRVLNLNLLLCAERHKVPHPETILVVLYELEGPSEFHCLELTNCPCEFDGDVPRGKPRPMPVKLVVWGTNEKQARFNSAKGGIRD